MPILRLPPTQLVAEEYNYHALMGSGTTGYGEELRCRNNHHLQQPKKINEL